MFLVETLKGLSGSGLIKKQDVNGELDFANCRLTEAGQAFLEQGRLSSIPERHGLRLHLDLITGEHIRLFSSSASKPYAHFLPPAKQHGDRLLNDW